jgi:hypothetical protein
VWKCMKHKNIVPLLGVTSAPLQLISDWMPGGELTEHIEQHPNADRLGLVGPNFVVFNPMLIPTASCLISLKAFTFSIPATQFMVISKEYVIVFNSVLPTC